jgi:hypothetical protein
MQRFKPTTCFSLFSAGFRFAEQFCSILFGYELARFDDFKTFC